MTLQKLLYYKLVFCGPSPHADVTGLQFQTSSSLKLNRSKFFRNAFLLMVPSVEPVVG